ncbi:MAG TPA: 50S ribosomal protein L18 [Candidatus Saccharimonadales bacterium]|nr:50S ribosomal protein L18 [Candidatus Saccharimonadales bacterium]
MNKLLKKLANLGLRKNRVRAKIIGTSERPRLAVFISNQHVHAQIIDDSKAVTIVSSTSVKAAAKGSLSEKAAWVGEDIAKKAKKAGVTKVMLDRGGRKYEARLKALAEAARKGGLEF